MYISFPLSQAGTQDPRLQCCNACTWTHPSSSNNIQRNCMGLKITVCTCSSGPQGYNETKNPTATFEEPGANRVSGWRGRWEGGSGWGILVNPWLIHVSVWQKPLQYRKVISLQLIKINGKIKECQEQKHDTASTPCTQHHLSDGQNTLDAPLPSPHVRNSCKWGKLPALPEGAGKGTCYLFSLPLRQQGPQQSLAWSSCLASSQEPWPVTPSAPRKPPSVNKKWLFVRSQITAQKLAYGPKSIHSKRS